VADAPQSQLAYAVSYFPTQDLYIRGQGRTYWNYYSEFDPFDRTQLSEKGIQTWSPPGFTVVDLHASYRLGDLFQVWQGGDLRLFANVYNLFDKLYIADAVDNSSFNDFDGDHDADDAEVFLGQPRFFNIGFEVKF
ncbi:MAG: TonB-dependent receptor, partial [Gemmatimonadetes bacterium]|nr:TonB-dependent receptor [Gemmatimonadota bacterium]